MLWKHLPIVAFDTETTGLQPFGGDRVIEFAAVVHVLGPDGQVVDEQRHGWLINPGMAIPRTASEISGIYDKDVADAPTFADISNDVHDLLANAVTVAHNYPFDMAFLTQEFLRIGMTWPEPLAEVDTVDVSIKHFSDAKSHKLVDLCQRLGVSLDGAHRATNDAAACGRSFVEMARRHGVGDDMQAMLDWANAIGRPPEDGPLGASREGRVVFLGGPHAGEPIVDHPIHLAWMEKARERGPSGWRFRFPEATRRWVRRWLEVRGAGRARQYPKSFHSVDWVLDSCIAVARPPEGAMAARA